MPIHSIFYINLDELINVNFVSPLRTQIINTYFSLAFSVFCKSLDDLIPRLLISTCKPKNPLGIERSKELQQ